MNRESNRIDRITTRRVYATFFFFLLAAVVVTGRLAKLQISEHDYYESRVLNQLTRDTAINPERGNITDRGGNILAANKTVYNVILSPHDIQETMKADYKKNSDGDASNDVHYTWEDADYQIFYHGTMLDEMIADVLSAYLPKTDSGKIYEKANKLDRYYEVIERDVEQDIADRIESFIAKYNLRDEVYFEASSKRYYPKDTLACHVIGFTNSDGVGVYGLERYYNNVLEGTSGRYILAQDAQNNDMPFEYERLIEATNGYNIVTTLDMYIQYELENQLEKTFVESGAGNRVCGMVMDTETGGILAMGVYPPFNCNAPSKLDDWSAAQLEATGFEPDSNEYLEAYNLLLLNMWNNKCVSDTYEPGSTFKVVTTSMAFDEGVVRDNDLFNCPGYHYVEGWPKPIGCAETSGHGTVTFRYGLQQSCNPTLMQVAERIGKQTFYDYFKAFGYGGRTGIDLPGESWTIYAPYKDFTNVSLAVYSFGQTFRTTPIQQLRAITAVANGGYLLTPHLLKEIVDDDGNVIQSWETEVVRQIVSSSTCEHITEILEEGVATDGAAKNAYVKGYRVAAKTGTSEKLDKFDEEGNTPFRVGSTVAYAPADDPQISALIVVDEPMESVPYGGVVAAPYISNLLSYVLPYLGVEPQYTAEELKALDTTVANYVGSSIKTAATDLETRGVRYELVGTGETVNAQVPEPGSKIASGTGKLILYTGGELPEADVKVPDLVGMSAYDANLVAVGAGLNVLYSGSTNGYGATVISQSPAADTVVTRGTVVVIELRHMDGTD
ncbi:MAG: PASTA domain-containing protein [Clostridia bacterium]|nr:PASTA domain-containing protein [Clostridia bacterium]